MPLVLYVATVTVTAKPLVAGTKLACNVPLFAAGTTLTGPADFSGWSVVDAEGTPISGVQIAYGDDGKSIWLNRSAGTVLLFR